MRTTSSGTFCSVSNRSILRTTILALSLAAASLQAQSGETGLRFREEPDGGFRFDTGVLRGKLRAGGKSGGLSDVIHVPSGKRISQTYGLFGHYRVFAANERFMPDVWATSSEAALAADGSVVAHWFAAADRPFEMWVTYRWSAPAVLDIETRVRAHASLRGFESFLASYFAEEFNRASVWTQQGKGTFIAADESGGAWQMFPRDEAAIRLIEDGRWKYPPNPVEWRIRANLALPIAIRREGPSALVAVVMAPVSDCFAASAPLQSDGHRSLYLSLFGRDLRDGETMSARARLVIGTFQDNEIINLYHTYKASLNTASPKPIERRR
jgi:hypothetical protein